MTGKFKYKPVTEHFFVWLALFFSLTAAYLSDYVHPWRATDLAYELVTILGLIASACMQYKFPSAARMAALAGAGLSAVAALWAEATSLSSWRFIFLRFCLAWALGHALCRANLLMDQRRSYLGFTSCALVSYTLLAFAQQLNITGLYFGAACAVCSGLGALFIALSRSPARPQSTGKQPPRPETRVAVPSRRSILLPLALLLIMCQMFNSFDMYIFSQLSQARFEGAEAVFPACVMLVGVGYFLGGVIAEKKGVSALFVAACTLSQFFLLLMLIGGGSAWVRLIPPLYILSSAGIDLCVILFPLLLRTAAFSQLRLISGVILFRVFKLYLIPSLFPERWDLMAGNRPVLILTIFAALGQMLLVIYIVVLKKNLQITRLRQMIARANPPQLASAPAPIPVSFSPPVAQNTPAPPPLLTSREKEVFGLLLAGKSRSEIAERMGITFSTVNKHCVSVYRKTECSSHLELLSKYGYSPGKEA